FLNLQSFDGSFLPSDKFYSWYRRMCYVKILKKEIGGDEQKVNENLEKVKEWVKKWVDEY
ncbi:8471_t:CDS:2, partial [Gigaspora rosea]